MLPILCCGELVGRLNAKAHRVDGVFKVKAFHAKLNAQWSPAQIEAVAQCAHWHGTTHVRITQTQPAGLRAPLRRASLHFAGSVG